MPRPLPPVGVVLAAAGEGRRLGARLPKALVPLAGKPLFLHSLEMFSRLTFVREIAVVLPEGWIGRIRRRHLDGRPKVVAVVPGGKRRQDSVRAGLEALATPLVLVHDAARPLIRAQAVEAVARAAQKHGGAVLASRAVDTVKLVDGRGRVVSTPERARVWLAETPQGFRRKVLEEAYRKAGRRDATDDAQLVERAGGRVVVVPSEWPNFKVTTAKDLERTVNLLDSL